MGAKRRKNEIIAAIPKILRLPNFAGLHPPNPGDAGFDLVATEGGWVGHGEITRIPVGIKTEFPSSLVALVRPRSGLAVNYGVHVLAGVIDSSYRGEWVVVLSSCKTGAFYEIERGDKIAQAIFVPVETRYKFVDKLSSTGRGEKGFGSTGKRLVDIF